MLLLLLFVITYYYVRVDCLKTVQAMRLMGGVYFERCDRNRRLCSGAR